MILSYIVLLDITQVNNLTHACNERSQEMSSESHSNEIHMSVFQVSCQPLGEIGHSLKNAINIHYGILIH